MVRLLEKFRSEVIDEMMKKYEYKNVWQVPRLQKVVINMGIGQGSRDAKLIDTAASELAMIAGQRPVVTRAKKSIAAFKLREGMPVGCKVTLRGRRMFEFLDRLIHVAVPRIRDFRGLPNNSFDGFGNYTFGLDDQTIFPEINLDKVEQTQGMDITFVTSTCTDEEALDMLRLLGFPFIKE